MYEHSKRRVARVLGLKRSYEVVYTYNATYAFNLLARNLIKTGMLTRGDVVLLGGAEHHANIVPWQILSEEYGIQIAWVALHADGTLDYDDMRSRLPKARVLSISGASNVTGEVLQFDVVQDMLDNCSNRPLWIVDGSQLFPHKTVDMVRYGIDIFVATGHKIMSDTGIGFFAANKALLQRLVPAFCGGGAINSVSHDGYEPAGLPFRHEPGTPHIAGAVSLGAALEYIESVGGHEAIWQYEQDLIRHFLSYIPTLPQGVRLIGSPTVENRL